MEKFPGSYNEQMRVWVFPPISIPKKGTDKLIHTTFYVGLMNSPVDKDILIKKMNPMTNQKPNPRYDPNFSFTNFAIPIIDEYWSNDPIANAIGFYATSTLHEGGNLSFKAITFVRTGKNLGRRNRTNVLTQAMNDVLGKYNKKNSESINKENKVVLPMLAKGEGISGDDKAIKNCITIHLVESGIGGLYCQRKYDGVRTLTTLNPKHYNNKVVLPFETEEHVVCYSRKGKPLQISNHLLIELGVILRALMERLNLSSLILDGEYYNHEIPFQQINGFARGESESSLKDKVNIYIYDYCDLTNTQYQDRCANLEENKGLFDYESSIASALLDDNEDIGHVMLCETKKYNKIDDILAFYKLSIEEGYEGIMLRTSFGTYEPTTRSNNLIKIKPLLSYEYECVGYKFGKGKDEDIPIIECVVGDKGLKRAVAWWQQKKGQAEIKRNDYKNGRFYAKLKGLTEAEQRQLGKEFAVIEANGKTRFDNFYLGKKVTIEFLDFSRDMKPEKANCKGFKLDD